MSPLPLLIVVGLLASGCALVFPGPSARLLAQADLQLAGQNYASALRFYRESLQARLSEAEAVRVRATSVLLEQLLASEAECERLRREVSVREAESARLRRHLASREAAIDRLKADLEKMKNIDLRMERQR